MGEVEQWVEAHKPGAVVGYTCSAGGCLVARYLEQKYGRLVHVSPRWRGYAAQFVSGRESYDTNLPDDMNTLVKQVDALTGELFPERSVTRVETLALIADMQKARVA